jgi:hypothetical protein
MHLMDNRKRRRPYRDTQRPRCCGLLKASLVPFCYSSSYSAFTLAGNSNVWAFTVRAIESAFC